jgi:formylglycine-generating enzyme required for sulfatase activity
MFSFGLAAALAAAIAVTAPTSASGENWSAAMEFDDCGGAGWCPGMIVIPAGSYIMGSLMSEPGRGTDEGPLRRVEIGLFAAGKFEVTFVQWAACVERGGCADNARPDDVGWGLGNRPVINVSWDDALSYVSWLSAETGAPYRLLTEAEWEYAARAGENARWSWGDDPDQACEYANLWDRTGAAVSIANCFDGVVRMTAEVGNYRANGFGLHDMHGNVWEWVEDCYADTYAGLPTNGRAHVAPTCAQRVQRGGGWYSLPSNLRSAKRNRVAAAERSRYAGFRVARTLD